MSAVSNLHVLVVEDEFLIAASLCDMLEAASAVVIGPATTIEQALTLLRGTLVEAAVLDVNLNGRTSDLIAEELRARRVPFILTTGYGSSEFTKRFGARVVTKPYQWKDVELELERALQDIA